MNPLINLRKKGLPIIALLLLVFSLSSCSATNYWWGEYQDRKWDDSYMPAKDFDNPFYAGLAAALTPFKLIDGDMKFNFISIIIGVIWSIAIVSVGAFILGTTNDTGGIKHYDIDIDGKRHHVTDYSEAYEIEGTGTEERGILWSNNIITFIISAFIFYLMYNWIIGWFDSLNMFFKVVIGGGIIFILYHWWDTLRSIAKPIKFISWVFCAIDFCLGIIVSLWIF